MSGAELRDEVNEGAQLDYPGPSLCGVWLVRCRLSFGKPCLADELPAAAACHRGCFVFLMITSAPPTHLSCPEICIVVLIQRDWWRLWSQAISERWRAVMCCVSEHRLFQIRIPLSMCRLSGHLFLNLYLFFFTCASFSCKGFKLFHNIYPSSDCQAVLLASTVCINVP